jgi:predicted glycosyltransferase
MNILIEIGHPAHVHFFSRTYFALVRLGHQVTVVTRSKEMTNQLLDEMGIPFICLSHPAKGKLGSLIELLRRWMMIGRILHSKRISVAASISGISTSFPAWVLNVRNILFTDTEDAKLSNRIAFPFADLIFTPEFFLLELGPKHRRFRGLHELSYLQNFDESGSKQIRKKLGISERYSILRLVSNDALHDSDIQGLSLPVVEQIVQKLSSFGEVWISSPYKLSPALEENRLKIPFREIHSILSGARLFLGESPTMAVESSLFGVPSLLVSGRVERLGNMIHLEKDFELLKCFKSWADLESKLQNYIDSLDQERENWRTRATRYREACENVDSLILSAILGERS